MRFSPPRSGGAVGTLRLRRRPAASNPRGARAGGGNQIFKRTTSAHSAPRRTTALPQPTLPRGRARSEASRGRGRHGDGARGHAPPGERRRQPMGRRRGDIMGYF